MKAAELATHVLNFLTAKSEWQKLAASGHSTARKAQEALALRETQLKRHCHQPILTDGETQQPSLF
jgi:hypothetical protein